MSLLHQVQYEKESEATESDARAQILDRRKSHRELQLMHPRVVRVRQSHPDLGDDARV